MDCIHQAFNFSCPSGLAKMQYPSGILLVCPLAISPIILGLICRFSPDGVICPMGRMAPDGPMGPMERWCPMAPDGPMGPMKTISRWARWARWIHLPDGPDGDNCPMGPIARLPDGRRPSGKQYGGIICTIFVKIIVSSFHWDAGAHQRPPPAVCLGINFM